MSLSSVQLDGPEQSENEYENFSPRKDNKGLFLEESNSPIFQIERNTPAETQEAKMSAASLAETIIVQPAEERREERLYSSQLRKEELEGGRNCFCH